MSQAALKTQPTGASVASFLNSIADEERRRDCKAVARLLKRISGKRPAMWGAAMVGYGRYRYRYASGREGEWFRLGFAPRKQDLTIYVMPGYTNFDHILARLGKHKKGKSCLYLKRLADVDEGVLEELVRAGWQDMLLRYPE